MKYSDQSRRLAAGPLALFPQPASGSPAAVGRLEDPDGHLARRFEGEARRAPASPEAAVTLPEDLFAACAMSHGGNTYGTRVVAARLTGPRTPACGLILLSARKGEKQTRPALL